MAVPALDPDAAARVAAFGPVPPMRDRGVIAVRAALEAAPLPDGLPAIESIVDCAAPGPAGSIPLRIYRPTADAHAPALVYFHGGGLVMGTNHSFEPLARTLAAASGATVISVEYRLAPESAPPAQFDDAYAATAWVAGHAAELGVDATRVAVVGDSAGGSLAAAVALAARDRGGPKLHAQVLLYPGLDRDMGAPSITAMPDAPMLRHDDIVYMHQLADCGATRLDHHRVPAYARDLSDLPQAIVVTGECDPIRDWGERYAARLRDAGVQTTLTRYPGVHHGFLMRSDATLRGRLAIAEVGALLRAKFENPVRFSFPITGHLPPKDDWLTPKSTHHAPTRGDDQMLTDERRMELSDVLRPTSPPREIHDVYTAEQKGRLLDVVHSGGPWKLIIAQHFASAEELMATMSGLFPEGFEPSLDLFLTPTFRGYLANYGAVLFPELHDVFYNEQFLDMAKKYWNAEYAKPELMLFNINGPCANRDPGHLDSPSFRGVRHENAPTWLCSVMGKSGLFTDYLIKMAQVITWFSLDEGSGFTYWPEGPLKAPRRVLPPINNRGVVVQNEMMVHRGEANGPLDQQIPRGLSFDTVFSGDPADRDRWLLKNGDDVIARHRSDELRFLVHWSAEVFSDVDELRKNMDGSDDLTPAKAIDMMVDDLSGKGVKLDVPSEPLHDPAFIGALNAAYDLGGPTTYPEEAPISAFQLT